jgi:hypothetical protein
MFKKLVYFSKILRIVYDKNLFKPKQSVNKMNKWAELLMGMILLVVAIYVLGMNILGMGAAALEFLKGGIIWLVIMVGLLFVMLGISDLKD